MVCSAHEIDSVRKVFKKEIITPGIRLGSQTEDQKRIMSPRLALLKSDWIVMGRTIIKGNIKNNIKRLINHLK